MYKKQNIKNPATNPPEILKCVDSVFPADVESGTALGPDLRPQHHRLPRRLLSEAHDGLQEDLPAASAGSVCRAVGPRSLRLWVSGTFVLGGFITSSFHTLSGQIQCGKSIKMDWMVDVGATLSPSLTGIPTHILLNTTGLASPAVVDRLELVSITGEVVKTLPILSYPGRQPFGLWNITEFIPPSEAFFLRVSGYDREGLLFQRVSSVSFSSVIPGWLKVKVKGIVLLYNYVLTIK